MSNTSALLALAANVRAWFAVQNPSVVVGVTGWKARFQHLNQGKTGANRVLFIPGDPQGRDGPLSHGRQTCTNPRDLLQWDRQVFLSVWAHDASDPSNDEAQIAAVENLLEQTFQGVIRAEVNGVGYPSRQAGAIHWGRLIWTVNNAELTFGREVLIDFALKSTFFDIPFATVVPTPVVDRNPAT